MNITEAVKSFFGTSKEKELSSTLMPGQVRVPTEDSDYTPLVTGFFDGSTRSSIFSMADKSSLLEKQKQKIMSYRTVARMSEVDSAIEEIVNEIIFSTDNDDTITIDIDEENEKIKEKIFESFDKIKELIGPEYKMYDILKSAYTDGQLVALLQYDKNTTKNGIQKIKYIDPVYFYFDEADEKYKYFKKYNDSFAMNFNELEQSEMYSKEEIVQSYFGVFTNNIAESYLEKAIKPANQLKTLEDLLIPFRFSRSMSRRVFNLDIGDVPPKQGEALLSAYQEKFQYKKFYNVESGEVTNQQHITSMVEDYWFANRSGGHGTTVDTIDETGNLGELGDIIYFYRKLYKALNIPTNRVPYQTDSDTTFDYSATNVTKEDMKFFMFISRLRKIVGSFFKEILKRELISTGTLTNQDWTKFEKKIKVIFTNENKFIEKMKLDQLTTQLDLYANAKDYAGSLFSYNMLMKRIFNFSEEEIEENLKEIQKERKNQLYKEFYKSMEEDGME